mmetsp:Transcript_15758/g.34263  ORF Transcript_15758/g.34263 Transcript_15758/m.34263 type:complete len:329 (-) Transcript_15758:293-1279(-)
MVQEAVEETAPAAMEVAPEPAEPALDLDALRSMLWTERNHDPQEGRFVKIPEDQLELLIVTVRQIFAEQPMLLEIDAPMKVAGDIHGQYYDFLRLLAFAGDPEFDNWLFLGDYVDRGKNSIECAALLFVFKALWPDNFFMLRGNHECAQINKLYGFFDECKRRYSIKLWKTFGDAFNYMPIAAVITDRILCMHGGLSPELGELDMIRKIPRPANVPESGLLCDILWSDPKQGITGWAENDRGVSFTFGADVVGAVLQRFNLDLVARAHQVVQDGYEFFAGRKLVTVFSAPNYCREFDNAAAVMNVDESLTCSFKVLKPSPIARRRPIL